MTDAYFKACIRVATARFLITVKTFQHFSLEHLNKSTRSGKHIKNAKESAISDNLFQCDPPITFDDFNALAPDSNKFKFSCNKNLFPQYKIFIQHTAKISYCEICLICIKQYLIPRLLFLLSFHFVPYSMHFVLSCP